MKIRGSSEFESTTGQIKKNELTGNNMIDCSMRVGDPIQTETKTQYESMVDEDKQDDDICSKYNLTFEYNHPNMKIDACNVIKKLEIDIFNLRGQLELSKELNEINEKIIKVQREEITELNYILEQARQCIFAQKTADEVEKIILDIKTASRKNRLFQ